MILLIMLFTLLFSFPSYATSIPPADIEVETDESNTNLDAAAPGLDGLPDEDVLQDVPALDFDIPVASPSEAGSVSKDELHPDEDLNEDGTLSVFDERPDFYYDSLEDMNDDEVLKHILSEVISINDSMAGPAATPSDAVPVEDSSTEDEEIFTDGEEIEATPFSLDADFFSQGSDSIYVNVLRFDITYNDRDYILLIPPEYVDSLYIDKNNRLWNMSTSNGTGRIVDAEFNPLVTEGKLMYLSPCLGNNFSTVNEYGSPNYMRTYYWSSSRLTYSTSYGVITVNKYHNPFYVSQTMDYIMLFVVTGGVLFICLNNYKRY